MDYEDEVQRMGLTMRERPERGRRGSNDSHSPLIPITNEWLYICVTTLLTLVEKKSARYPTRSEVEPKCKSAVRRLSSAK